VIWYAYDKDDKPLNPEARKLGGHWVMAVFDITPGIPANFAFYTSTNLKEWTEQSHLPGYHECPEIFELPVDGDESNTRWVVFDAHQTYALGDFDGKVFTPAHEGKYRVHHGSYYASQTFSNPPDGRRIQMGWARVDAPGMPFNQGFSFPHEITLRKTEDGVRMFARPIAEIEKLHRKKHTAEARELVDGKPVNVDVAGELFDVRATFEVGKAMLVGLSIGENRVVFHVGGNRLENVAMKPVDGKVSLHVLVDRLTIEICGNDGRVYITKARPKKGDVKSIQAFASGGTAKLVGLEVHELKSIWNK